ncbi:MAG: class I SAM-dependent RNA methyltransferase, partial [Gemmatimonadales bacterium]|nr:class I SAM-dependent RNA methyltransferase [Gemmatimonadales bacterium]
MSGEATDQELVEVSVRALSSSGAGVADLPEGQVVFVPRTAPGDRVRIRLGKMKKRWGKATIDEMLEQSANRVKPACALFDECGGCSLQHIPYETQLEWKAQWVRDALERIAHIQVETPDVTPSPAPLGYRNRVTYTLRRLRGGRIIAGFHALGRPAHVIEVEHECMLPEPELKGAWIQLRAVWGMGARLLPGAGRLRLTLRKSAGGVVLLVEGGEAGWRAKALAEAATQLVAIWHRPSGNEPAVRITGDQVFEAWEDESVPVAAGAFLQVNRAVAKEMQQYVGVQVGEADSVVDAYCGVGAYARVLARRGASVTGIELDPEACEAARFEAPATLQIVEGSVEECLAETLPTEVLI